MYSLQDFYVVVCSLRWVSPPVSLEAHHENVWLHATQTCPLVDNQQHGRKNMNLALFSKCRISYFKSSFINNMNKITEYSGEFPSLIYIYLYIEIWQLWKVQSCIFIFKSKNDNLLTHTKSIFEGCNVCYGYGNVQFIFRFRFMHRFCDFFTICNPEHFFFHSYNLLSICK